MTRTMHDLRRLLAIPAIALFLLALAAVPAAAQEPPPPPPPPGAGPGFGPGPGGPGAGPGGMHGGRWWRDPQLRAALGLTDDQVRRIQDTWYRSQEDGIDLGAAARKAHLELARLLQQETLDPKALDRAIDAVVDADAALNRHRLETRVAIAQILTPEQRGKLENLMRSRRGPRRGKGGPGHPPGPRHRHHWRW